LISRWPNTKAAKALSTTVVEDAIGRQQMSVGPAHRCVHKSLNLKDGAAKRLVNPSGASPKLARGALWTVAVFVLGIASAAGPRWLADDDPAKIQTATREIQALGQDIGKLFQTRRGGMRRKRGIHKRVYSYVQKYGDEGAFALNSGAFAGLFAQGLPEDRASYFLEPWNAPYWIRKRTHKPSGYVIVSADSFGPNSRRESTEWEILGDDIGTVIFENSERPDNLEFDVD
jgi:hypothetical protein